MVMMFRTAGRANRSKKNNAKGSTEAPSQCQPAFPQSRGGRGNLNLRQNAASRRNRPVPNVEEGNHRPLLLVAKGPCRAFAIGIHSFSSVGAPRHRRCTRSVSPRLVGRPPSGRGCRTHANISHACDMAAPLYRPVCHCSLDTREPKSCPQVCISEPEAPRVPARRPVHLPHLRVVEIPKSRPCLSCKCP